ncbi:hypothetical protein M9Y10_041371 [Tritrichomonas musculus]|uniref:Uncharacterized protein n=1 Tax=Tritrichomonas musculus TaxID=1915356 RepID=A0ABR2K4X3_9EUKA
MFVVKPPSIDKPLEMKKYLTNYKNYIFSQEIITEKFKYLAYMNSIFPDVRPDVQSVIYDGIFSLARDLSPAIRERALQILSETAPIPNEWIPETLSKGKEELESLGKTDVISSSSTINFQKGNSYKSPPHGKPNSKTSMVNRPYIGTIGMCLEDPYPEVRSKAISALVKSVTKSDDENVIKNSIKVMTTITQLTNDASPLVRTSAIKGLYQTSSIVGHLVELEDSQLRLILPIIVDKESHQHDRIEVLKFIERLFVTSYDQIYRVSFDLTEAVDRCDWGFLLVTAYTFGRHNHYFTRIISSDLFSTLWSYSFEFPYPKRKILIKIIIILGAYDEEPFPLQKTIQKIGPIFTPLLMLLRKQYEENMEAVKNNEDIKIIENHSEKVDVISETSQKVEESKILLNKDIMVNGAVDLDYLEEVIQNGSDLSIKELLALNDALKDSCNCLLKKGQNLAYENEKVTIIVNNNNGAVTSTNIPQSPNSLSSLNFPNNVAVKSRMVKYKGQINPIIFDNSKFVPIPYSPQGNFNIPISGKITPYPKDAVVLLSMKIPLLDTKLFPLEVKPDGSFLFQPTINLPPFSPYCRVELALELTDKDDKVRIPITDKPHEIWFKMQ